ncbi:MAG: hypothetical protein K1X75_03800 [Leptospirales bacterium]|nr:hypothetical protein [Leptospirales bacterium]
MNPAPLSLDFAAALAAGAMLGGLSLSLLARNGIGQRSQGRRAVAFLLILCGLLPILRRWPPDPDATYLHILCSCILSVLTCFILRTSIGTSARSRPAAFVAFRDRALLTLGPAAVLSACLQIAALRSAGQEELLWLAAALLFCLDELRRPSRRSWMAPLGLSLALGAHLIAEVSDNRGNAWADDATLLIGALLVRFGFRRRLRSEASAALRDRRRASLRRSHAAKLLQREQTPAEIAAAVSADLESLTVDALSLLEANQCGRTDGGLALQLLDRLRALHRPLELLAFFGQRRLNQSRLAVHEPAALFELINLHARQMGGPPPILAAFDRLPAVQVDGELLERCLIELSREGGNSAIVAVHVFEDHLRLSFSRHQPPFGAIQLALAEQLCLIAGISAQLRRRGPRLYLLRARRDAQFRSDSQEAQLRFLARVGARRQAEHLAVQLFRRRPWRRKAIESLLLHDGLARGSADRY